MKRQIGSFFYRPAPRTSEIRRKRWNVLHMIGKALKRVSTVIGATFLFCMLMGVIIGAFFGEGHRPMPDDMILVLNVEEGIGENAANPSLMDPLAGQSMTVHEFISTLDYAKDDERVRGLLVSLDSARIELAHIQEIRVAIHEFRAARKFAHLYTPSFADLGSGIGAYYLASAFDQIWMQPIGMLTITGIAMEMPFGKGALDKLGVEANFLHREEYKSAMESFTNSEMSPANREMVGSLVKDISIQMMGDITTDRKITPALLTALVDKGLLTGDEALKAGLITRLDYADKLVDEVRAGKTEDELPLVAVEDYYRSIKHRPTLHAKDVALVSVAGQIVQGSKPEPGFATSDYIADALYEAADDEDIKAIVVRVDSPGGSPSASETIRRAIVYAKEKGKKIVVSMGPLAASGGYWVSVDADRIFAMPSTLTGSIGVIMGKFQLGGLWEKLGINWDRVRWGEHSGMWSANESFTPSELERLNAAIDDTYKSFVERVAKGRKMKPEDVRKIAKGRAWTGAQAVQNGLVDELGGLDSALNYTATQLGLENRDDLNIILMPKPLTPVEQLMMMMGEQVGIGQFLKANAGILEPFAPWADEYRAAKRMGVFQAYDSSGHRMKY